MTDSIKKRKWDQDDYKDESVPEKKMTKLDSDPTKAASEAAARINAMLQQKGIPLHVEDSKEGEFTKNIPINDLKNRYTLTRGATQAQIHEETGADVTTRGKFYPDLSLAAPGEPPLYLHVSAKTKESLDKAVKKIEELIETAQVPVAQQPEKVDRRFERKFFEKKLPVNVPGNPPFNLRAKIVGPQGAFVKHIVQETGARVQLKGKGSGFIDSTTGKESEEDLHVHITCMKEDGLDAAIKLTEDLLNTVRQEAERAQSYGYGRGRPSYNGYYNSYNPAAVATPPAPVPGAPADTNAYAYDYSQYYSGYYNTDTTNQYQSYDASSYYNYYGYPPTTTADATTAPPSGGLPPPPPPSSVPPNTSSTSPPPPPPPSSNPSIPPPPPPGSSSVTTGSSLPPPPPATT
ncbi:hypothetical protein G6F57_012580 [Rhizopus arrhizus]|uniref:K Homology domain-containing protein n=1 Tax=Rhizopus oryzae TaxID=64495 RepID=A0A9P7BLH6_RHIOR|nr:hypothetical protein G6F23_008347 [Rhizopus arrhizus]KAG0755061.1 hypothetical protein G6F24_012087 [Rhizopus arrhizus]KAG0781117.1 hypothetical protein G6F21_011812 [Rhizopus arrhizus]KAG0799228.1 hypothetical protein G6F22_003435 [Rhizopus arrhizus]KAG0805357.1 hypothetical protein G6F20_011971 [Rhizopus arrhizus]